MAKLMHQIREFHNTFKIKDSDKQIRHILIEEEHKEAQRVLQILQDLEIGHLSESPNKAELKHATRVHLAKELADVVYVVAGTAKVYGIDLDRAVEEVHMSNMSKLDANGEPIFSDSGKVLKSEFYKEPDMEKALQENQPKWKGNI